MNELIDHLLTARAALHQANIALEDALKESGIERYPELERVVSGCKDSVKRSTEWLEMQTLDYLPSFALVKKED